MRCDESSHTEVPRELLEYWILFSRTRDFNKYLTYSCSLHQSEADLCRDWRESVRAKSADLLT